MKLPYSGISLKRMALWVGLFVSLLASAYCCLGVLMAGSFGGQLNYPVKLAALHAQRWGAGVIFFLCVALASAVFLYLGRRAES
jgi:hypothetical protein